MHQPHSRLNGNGAYSPLPTVSHASHRAPSRQGGRPGVLLRLLTALAALLMVAATFNLGAHLLLPELGSSSSSGEPQLDAGSGGGPMRGASHLAGSSSSGAAAARPPQDAGARLGAAAFTPPEPLTPPPWGKHYPYANITKYQLYKLPSGGARDSSPRCKHSGICDGDTSCGEDGLGCITDMAGRRERVRQATRWSWRAYT